MENIKQLKNERKAKDFITDEKFIRVLRYIGNSRYHEYRDYICIQLLLDAGMRIGECLLLLVNDIDMVNRSIYLRAENTKGRSNRYVYFSQEMQKELRRWLQYKDRYIE